MVQQLKQRGRRIRILNPHKHGKDLFHLSRLAYSLEAPSPSGLTISEPDGSVERIPHHQDVDLFSSRDGKHDSHSRQNMLRQYRRGGGVGSDGVHVERQAAVLETLSLHREPTMRLLRNTLDEVNPCACHCPPVVTRGEVPQKGDVGCGYFLEALERVLIPGRKKSARERS